MTIDKNFKQKMLNWANQFNIFCFLDNNKYNFEAPAFECMLAVGCKSSYTFTGNMDAENLQAFYDKNPTWLFGHFNYNAFGNAYEEQKENNSFKKGFFFEPEIIIKISNENIEIIKSNIDKETIFAAIEKSGLEVLISKQKIIALPLFAKEKYIAKIKKVQEHIARGDCYEINFCQKYEATNATIAPIETYQKLAALSPAPFGALYKVENNYCICSSPERFLEKQGTTIISQPIKGTSRRVADKAIDAANKLHLTQSEKEKSENVMIVDLVRNDLSMVCKKGSVHVKELFGVYSFPQVHQMISTIQGQVDKDEAALKLIKACFPMGSMTGAPKQKVIQLIEKYEEIDRGLFSGSIGYFTPENNFDFNVVIRSIFYNDVTNTLHFFAGSGITFYSNAEKEYDECLAKTEAMLQVLQ
jgi:para-aminobenzoate synthetase component I